MSLHSLLRPALRRLASGFGTTLAAGLALACGASLRAQLTPPLPSATTLKRMSLDQLMELEVTSVSKRPERLAEAASAIQVITADEIRRAGATRIPEALALASNLEVAQVDARQWAITARGFNNVFADKMLVLIDGRTVYTPLYAGVYWDVQDTLLADLDRIEVISGPGATQWGANAVNGVINITSLSARDTQGGLLAAGWGSELQYTAEARYGGQLAPDFHYRIYAKTFDRDDSVRSNGQRANDAWRTRQVGFRADYTPASGDVITFQGDVYDGNLGQVGPDSIRATGGNLLGRWMHAVSQDSDVKLQLYYDHTYRRMPGSFTQDLDTYDLDFQHHLRLPKNHDLVWGAAYRFVQDDVINTPANAFLPAHAGRQWLSAFAQDNIPLFDDRVHVTVGTKVEHNDYTGVEFEPSLRLAWRLPGQQTLWGAVSRAVRTPSRIDRDLFSPATPPYRITGGTKVVSEKLIAYELGYRVQFEPRVAVSLATFYNDYDDLRSLEPLNPPLAFPATASSGLRGHSSGAELSAEWQVSSRWRLRAGWTELRVHSEPQPGNLDRPTRDSIARDPNHQASLRSLFDLGAQWECDMTLRYVAGISNQMLPGYTEGDIRLGWHPTPALELSLLGQNLLHGHHPEFNSPGARREIERSVYGRATWRF